MFDTAQGTREVRRVAVDDLPWAMSLGYRRYGAYDPGKTLLYLAEVLSAPQALFIRTDDAFLLAAIITPVWRSDGPECNVLALCSEPGAHWQAIRLLRRSVGWAKERGCRSWWFASETHYDISALAKRVGAVVAHPRYRIDLA